MTSQIGKKSVDLIFADPLYNLSGNGLRWKGNKTGGDWYMMNEEWDKIRRLDFRRKMFELRPRNTVYFPAPGSGKIKKILT